MTETINIFHILFLFIYGLSYRYVRGVDEHESYGWPAWMAKLLNKYTWAILMGVLYGWIEWDAVKALVVGFGSAAGVALGWGKYFQMWGKSTFGRGYSNIPVWSMDEREFWLADKAGNWIYRTTREATLANIIAMGVRYGVCFLPMFIALGYLQGSLVRGAIASLLVFLTGVIYYYAGRIDPKEPNQLAEVLVGLFLGFLIILTGV